MSLLTAESYQPFMGKAELHKSINTLMGILNGIELDREINDAEVLEIQNWCDLHRHCMERHPFCEVISAVESALSDKRLDPEEVDDILWLCDRLVASNKSAEYFDIVASSIQRLEGILHGILADNVINDDEIERLREWMDDSDFLRGTYPFDEIYSLIIAVREDGVVTEYERNMLRAFFATFIDMSESYNINGLEMKAIQSEYSIGGICAIDPDISFEGKTFCITGESQRAARHEMAHKISLAGGTFRDAVTKKTDYLIVGTNGNPCWAFACYGRKVEKAIALRKAGGHIVIVNEVDFWDALG